MKPTKQFIHYFCLCCCCLFMLPTIEANSTINNVAVISMGTSALPAKAKTPEKRRKKKVKHPEKLHKGLSFLIYGLLLGLVVGAILFGIGVAIWLFGLWLVGLLMFGGINLGVIFLLYVGKLSLKKGDSGFAGAVLALFFLVMGAFNLLVGLIFLIWGLLIFAPVMWIVAILCLILVFSCLIGIFIKNEK